jgi:hypothetical protein
MQNRFIFSFFISIAYNLQAAQNKNDILLSLANPLSLVPTITRKEKTYPLCPLICLYT